MGAHLKGDVEWPTGTAQEATEKWRSHLTAKKSKAFEAEKKIKDEKIEKLAIEKAKEMVDAEKEVPLKGVVVFYIDVGQLSPTKCEEFIDRMKKKANLDRWPKEYESMWISTRTGGSRIEKIDF